jgi:hypothetical protein
LYIFVFFKITAAAPSLSDQQIVGGNVVLLNGVWDATSPSQNLSIKGTIPGIFI